MFRIILFLITNLAVILFLGVILILIGIKEDSLYGLIIFSSIFGFGGSFISLFLSKWIALNSINGKVITKSNIKFENWLINSIEYYSKKVGIKTPDIVVYQAKDINAFATGSKKNSALIAVSSALLEKMSQDEIEAVIAHEISHISNGDMVTMSLLQGVINTFVIFISRVISGLISGFISDKNIKNGENNSFFYNLISLILEVTFGFLATIVIMWFSRYREFKADAGSAKLVGKNKMILALERLKTSCAPKDNFSMISFCINGNNHTFSDLFLSHPSLEKRIEALILETYFVK